MHVSSKKLIDKLEEYLEYPQFDPHGDPIPDSRGKIKNRDIFPLEELPLNQVAEVVRVSNQSAHLLDLLQHKSISIGTRLEVKKQFDFDHSIEVKIKPNITQTISEQLAKNIFVSYEL